MNKFFENLPDIIRASASSALGILALSIIALAALALVFFRQAAERTKVFIFLLLLLGAVAFGTTVLRQSRDLSPSPSAVPSPSPTVTAPPVNLPLPPTSVPPLSRHVENSVTPRPSKPRVYVYYANENQVPRLDSRLRRVLSDNNFEVVESRQLTIAEAPMRPEITEIMHFSSSAPDLTKRLREILLREFASDKMKHCNVLPKDSNAGAVTQNRQPGEFVIWFGKVVGSPIPWLHEP